MTKIRGFEVVSVYQGTDIRLPIRKTKASAGYDLSAAEDAVIAPGGSTLVPTGLKAYMQENEVLLLYIRSSVAHKQQLMLMNSVGVIDADYYDNAENEGHILIPLYNFGAYVVHIARGERIVQGIFTDYLAADGDAAGIGPVRQGGFGSTGM